MRWRPLLPPELHPKARTVVLDLAERVAKSPTQLQGLADGEAGAALFFLELAKSEPRFEALGEDALGRACELASTNTQPGFLQGTCGVAWALDHHGGESQDVTELLAELLEVQGLWPGDFDLVSGLVGYGVLALQRASTRLGAGAVGRVIDHLEALAVAEGDGAIWPTAPEAMGVGLRATFPNGCVDLGIAHGSAGIAAFLVRCLDVGVVASRARTLLARTMKGLLPRIRAEETTPWTPRVPVAIHESTALRTRNAWCYGDLGAAHVLIRVAAAQKDPALEAYAVELGKGAARLPHEEGAEKNPWLCHGAAGVALLLMRLSERELDGVFAERATAWLLHLLDEAAKFPAELDPTFLDGAAGVGLVLLASMSETAPSWDEILLLS